MNITNVRIRKMFSEEESPKMRALVSITLDDSIAIHDIKVIENEGHTFLAMPSRKAQEQSEDGSVHFMDIVHPIHASAREELEKSIFPAYFSAIESLKEEYDK